jgi:hypothetical protein
MKKDLEKALANIARVVENNMSYSSYRKYMREARELKDAIERLEFNFKGV